MSELESTLSILRKLNDKLIRIVEKTSQEFIEASRKLQESSSKLQFECDILKAELKRLTA